MLATMTWTQWLLAVTIIGVCLFLMLVILLQRGRGGGVAGAFGGGGGSGAFGAKTGDVFTWITVVVAAIFVGLTVIANYAFDESRVASSSTKTEVPAEPVSPPSETTQIFPITVGKDGEMLPINLESVEITPSKPAAEGEAPSAEPKPQPSGDGETRTKEPEKSEEKPATP